MRALRRRHGLRQVDLAQKMGISASYLNLIEHDQRALTAPLLLRLAELYPLDLKSFAPDDHARLISDLHEVFGDALFEAHDLTTTDLRETASNESVSHAIVKLYRAYRDALEGMRSVASKVSEGGELTGIDPARLPSEEVSDVLQENQNYFPDIEDAAERIAREAGLERPDVYPGLVRDLEREGISVAVVPQADARRTMRAYDPQRRRIELSEQLSPHARAFQLAHQIGLLRLSDEFERIVRRSRLTTPDSVTLCRVALASYFAGALLMPYEPFLEAARALRYDVELLERRFGVSFEQVCHRLTTLRRPGREGVPFHFIRVDIAGNISKRFSASGIQFARFSGLCPRWNVHSAFMTPGMVRIQLSRMADGTTYLCVARTVRQSMGGFGAAHPLLAISLGCEVSHARHLVYGDSLDLENPKAAVPIGITCRLCERLDCDQRAFPPIHRRLGIDENVRTATFYTPGE
ncbi:MAG TPA: short-chain fatty acyl-CoA regulator family protein [Thermoanaerobaculia bacterium]|nr:short-chain fatty acyl-CoA regulator family protein [Thermoanaerobaculia bacterium]